MHLSVLVTMMFVVFTAMVAAQPICDSQTQYLSNDECCKKCKPGKRMKVPSCGDPLCEDCEEFEYQDEYTISSTCKKQKYCDPHKNFQLNSNDSKMKLTECLCLTGYHCSSTDCLTCVPHTNCPPGQEAKSIGNQTHNTVCQQCPTGSFSNETSWNGVCKKWTECKYGYKESGTDISDSICEETPRQHIILACVLPVAALAIACIVIAIACPCRDAKRRVKGCVESCHGERQVPLGENHKLMVPPVDDPEKDLTFPEQPSSHEEGSMRTPEENEDEPSEDFSGVVFTDKGNYVTQENGKTEILSRQESQTQTFTD